jgi:hypothetical protein
LQSMEPETKREPPFDFKTNLSALFRGKNHFAVPNYQRAYSWEVEKQVSQFIQDIQEHPQGIKQYHFGHFLFENDRVVDSKFWVIDGQQRMTTFFIFLCALRNVIRESENYSDIGNAIDQTYLRNPDVDLRMETVDYDSTYFRNVLINGLKDVSETRSRVRISEAYYYFVKIINQSGVNNAIQWKDLLENAKVTTDVVDDKSEAVQIFAFQNDRGKHLSNLEKLKAYLMLQVYTNETITNSRFVIKAIEDHFVDIYKALEKFNLIEEDQLLNFHTVAFLSVGETSLERVKSKLGKVGKHEQEGWIRAFVSELKTSCFNTLKIQQKLHGDTFLGDVLCLDTPNAYPLLLKLFHYNDDDRNLENILRLTSVILFRMKFSMGKYYSNYLPQIANEYGGDVKGLFNRLMHHALNGFKSYWTFESDFHACLDGDYHYWPMTRYLLWQYENSLRVGVNENKIPYSEFANFYGGNLRMETTIDHWLAQHPDGFVHEPEMVQKYVNNIGNLVLAPRARNSSDNNSLPFERDTQSPLISRQLLEKDKNNWGKEQIKQRQAVISAFAKAYWDPRSINMV